MRNQRNILSVLQNAYTEKKKKGTKEPDRNFNGTCQCLLKCAPWEQLKKPTRMWYALRQKQLHIRVNSVYSRSPLFLGAGVPFTFCGLFLSNKVVDWEKWATQSPCQFLSFMIFNMAWPEKDSTLTQPKTCRGLTPLFLWMMLSLFLALNIGFVFHHIYQMQS